MTAAEKLVKVETSHICFRCWESWSLGGLEEFYNLLAEKFAILCGER
jgi:hypothetical protein